MAVKEKFPPWFHRIRLALEEGWQHHGLSEHISIISTFDDDSSEWRLIAAPVFQEIFGGSEDGRKVWTPFVFDATDLVVPGLFTVPGLKIEKMAVLTRCPECQHGPRLVLHGTCDGEKLSLHVLLEPVVGSEPVEVIDTIHEVIRERTQTDESKGHHG